MAWFRLDVESILDDPRLARQTPSAIATFIQVMALAKRRSDNGDTRYKVPDLAWALRRDVSADVDALVAKGLLYLTEDGTVAVVGWLESQFASRPTTATLRETVHPKKAKPETVEKQPAIPALADQELVYPTVSQAEKRMMEPILAGVGTDTAQRCLDELAGAMRQKDIRTKTGYLRKIVAGAKSGEAFIHADAVAAQRQKPATAPVNIEPPKPKAETIAEIETVAIKDSKIAAMVAARIAKMRQYAE